MVATRPSAVLNVNVPNVPLSSLRGFEPARLAPFGAVHTHVTETGKGYVKLALEEIRDEAEPGTDVAFLAAGFACYTSLAAACERSVEPLARLHFETPAAGRP
jgi:5'-nucleotidase